MRDLIYVIGEYALKSHTPNEAAELASTIQLVGTAIILIVAPLFAVLFGRLFIKSWFGTDRPKKNDERTD